MTFLNLKQLFSTCIGPNPFGTLMSLSQRSPKTIVKPRDCITIH